MIRTTLLTALLAALPIGQALASETPHDTSPHVCGGLYYDLSLTPRASQVIANYSAIRPLARFARVLANPLDRAQVQALRSGLPSEFSGIRLINRNSPQDDAAAVEHIAACDRAFGFEPVAELGARDALNTHFTCAVSYRMFSHQAEISGAPQEVVDQGLAIASHATARHRAERPGLDEAQLERQITAAASARVDRLIRDLESNEGFEADIAACWAKYEAEQSGRGG